MDRRVKPEAKDKDAGKGDSPPPAATASLPLLLPTPPSQAAIIDDPADLKIRVPECAAAVKNRRMCFAKRSSAAIIGAQRPPVSPTSPATCNIVRSLRVSKRTRDISIYVMLPATILKWILVLEIECVVYQYFLVVVLCFSIAYIKKICVLCLKRMYFSIIFTWLVILYADKNHDTNT